MKIGMSRIRSGDTKQNSGVLHPLLGGVAVIANKRHSKGGG